jgi:fumarylacetoacetase
MNLNETHDPKRKSFVESANAPGADFPIQNLPFCVFSRAGEGFRGGVAIGDQLVDLSAALHAGLFSGAAEKAAQAASGASLNALMALGNGAASALRARLSDLLRSDSVERNRVQPLLVPQAQVKFAVPASVGTFTDFLCSYDHTFRMSRTGDLPPAFKHLPIAYHSRASTVICGDGFHRPNAQSRDKEGNIRFGPEQALDFELEMGAYIGVRNEMGTPVSLAAAPDHIFGYCLLNDWSARGIQAWESTPLGPFLGKSFATSISPFVVTGEALLPFGVASRERAAGDPQPLPYLSDKQNLASGALDITLDAYMVTKRACATPAKRRRA